MLQSKLFPRTRREAPKDEVSINAQFLIRAGFVDKTMAGVYTFLPLGQRVLEKIVNIVREEMKKADGQEILMPVLQPKENWQKTGRWDSLDVLFKFTSYYSKTEYALGPTHEEIVAPLAGITNLSYKNLPLSLFQIQTKFRDEKRAKSGVLRGREFLMKDLYSFHESEEDLDKYYDQMVGHYHNVFKNVGLGEKTILTYASGGSFSKYSHEFQTLSENGEDSVFLCEKCNVAVNQEIISDQNVCPVCGSKDLVEKKAIEVGNIFKLKTKFSEPFNLKYTDRDGQEKPVIMGCYGIGPTRIMGTAVELFHDEKGIIWPKEIAPFRVHLIELGEPKEETKNLYNKLIGLGVEVLCDDRNDTSAGEKFADADLIGIPFRVVVSEKTLAQGKFEIKNRNEKEIKLLTEEELITYVR